VYAQLEVSYSYLIVFVQVDSVDTNPKVRSESGRISLRSERPETGQKRSVEELHAKLKTKTRSEAGWPKNGHEAEPQDLWRSGLSFRNEEQISENQRPGTIFLVMKSASTVA